MRDIESYSREYHALPFEATQLAFRRRLVLEQVSQQAPSTLLEIGCGLRPLFQDLPAALEVTVVEPSAEFAAHARELAGARQGVEVVQGFLEDVPEPLREGGFDFIVLSSLLHEVADPQALLQAVRRHCHADTLVHVNVPNAYSLHRLLAVEMGLIEDPFERSATQQRMQQHSTFDLASLGALVASAGFEVQDSGSYFIKPFTHAQMQTLCDSGFLTPAHLEGLYGLARRLPGCGSEIFVNARLAHV
ncbi:class I SAM-dependent methyltransferase [Pseudomonas nitroreducens]|uniref:class I SAM-dependent methyltransferase n=1 Tax=Pseudomonas nitroreducens TaxID=46680 RepID=UPI002657E2C7|nr:class I SAM-dependent methyltransferase [Pseudomonas nitroreducens]MCP1651227.1 2-polyprenyl-3-methyl-5-hydroxy-6-metoxy-1,4-benzoquinol methylase [Pseudomonas nitroreducens]MCP1684248.1 2-polyprenyl-3-methyl-5-hydroxy-6-metoxy-1,4-benzoquinol methylase [Pseudomonas nitroreducens]